MTTNTWNAAEYNSTASFVYSTKNTAPVLEYLNANLGESILDFGCGSGELTKVLMSIVGNSGIVVGLDSSPNMIARAQENGVENNRVTDIQDPSAVRSALAEFGPNRFDAVFTNAALHWCKRSPQGVIQSASESLKPGGRFVGEMGGFTNLVGLRSHLHLSLSSRGYNPSVVDPWYFPTSESFSKLLESQGFQVKEIGLHPRITPIPRGLRAWLDLFVRDSMLLGLHTKEVDEILNEVVERSRADMFDRETDSWVIMYVRLRWIAVKTT